MDTQERKQTPAEKQQEIMEAREIADSEITEPAFVNPVQRHRGYTVTVLVVLAICAVALIADLFYYANRKDRTQDSTVAKTEVMKQQTQAQPVALPGLTVVAQHK